MCTTRVVYWVVHTRVVYWVVHTRVVHRCCIPGWYIGVAYPGDGSRERHRRRAMERVPYWFIRGFERFLKVNSPIFSLILPDSLRETRLKPALNQG